MSGVTGRDTAVAFAKFGTNSWGVPASVTKGVLFNTDGGMTYEPAFVEDNAYGQDFLGQAEAGDIASPDLTWTTRDRYEGTEYIFQALAMGSPATVTISTSTSSQTTSWKHVFDLAPSIDGLGITAAIDKVVFVEELTSAKVYGFSFTTGDGGGIDISFKLMGSKTAIDSTTNTRSTVNGAAFPALRNRLFRKQGVFRMNLQSAGSLVATDAQTVEKIDFEFSRPQDAPFVFGQDYVIEPGDNGFPEFSINLTYPRMNTVSANSLRTALPAGTVFKADLTFLGVFINSTDRLKEMYEFPHFELQKWTGVVDGATQSKPTAMFKMKLAPTSPTGMPFVNPFRLTRIMSNSVHAFA